MEHYVTLFDSNFLPSGLCLHESLTKHATDFTLWVVCMDKKVEQQLTVLRLPNVELISLESVENERLLSVKNARSKGEYCWTMTPFVPEMVFERNEEISRVTYIDADLFFFDSPTSFFEEFEHSNKHVLITEHAYAPEYERCREYSGRFCVQFMAFRRTEQAIKVMRWWQDRCIEWCFARFENGLFGDQKYLDVWPHLFGDSVHILTQSNKTLAPWNVKFFLKKNKNNIKPIFYHFHGFRIINHHKIKLFEGYRVGYLALDLYAQYLSVLYEKLRLVTSLGYEIPVLQERKTFFAKIKNMLKRFFKTRLVINFRL